MRPPEGLEMSLSEVLPNVRSLSRTEKLQLIQVLAQELAEAENVPAIPTGQSYPIWSPFDAFGAAEVLWNALQAEKGKQ